MSTLPPGTIVRALRRIVDPDAAETWPDEAILELYRSARAGEASGAPIAAEPGDVGQVLEHLDGEHLIVAFKRAPCAVDVDPANVAPFMVPLAGGLP